ncbi:helix-turn-helix domain-containing protein [Glaciecola sp. KUL10]|jgi:CheY-like chemotaxis protein|uniref:helix-turn-helix domain-containing protein n=1 Tax=Glaciecola sp. (strain KUL10) TaxID=2161813 RepID=UPI000D782D41|nr:helix-turn-helix domain-containing protein [Glaciecola sp. KUL10]GBL03552.1 response regulator [Glaciecola sp. KUL10]
MKSFSSGEVAKVCDVNPRTVIRWIEAGKLKAFKLPGRGNNRVKHADLISFLEDNQIPIPVELSLEQEKLCFIVSKEKQLIRHSQRIARNSGYVTHVYGFGIDAGIELSMQKPAVIIVDNQTSKVSAFSLMETIKRTLDYVPYLIIFDEYSDNALKAEHGSKIYHMAKPIDNYAFSMVLDVIVDNEKDAVA